MAATNPIVFITWFLLFWWLMLVYYKLNLNIKIYNLLPYKFIDDLTNCEFCQESHIGTILSACLYVYTGDYYFFLYGFMFSALSNLLKE